MNDLKKYVYVQIAFTLLVSIYLLVVTLKNIQYGVLYFPVSLIVFVFVTNKKIRKLSLYLKEHHFELYKKRSTFRPYFKEDLSAVNILTLSLKEINTITDRPTVQLIQDLKNAYKTLFITMAFQLALLIARALL